MHINCSLEGGVKPYSVLVFSDDDVFNLLTCDAAHKISIWNAEVSIKLSLEGVKPLERPISSFGAVSF